MRRSICYCEPNSAQAGESRTWKFIYTPSATLPKGSKIRFDMQSSGRDIDWEIPNTNLKKAEGAVYADLGKGKILQAEEIDIPGSFAPLYEFILPAALEAGKPFTIVLGAKEGEGKKGASSIRAQTVAQRRRPFLLYVDTTGKGHFDEPEVFSMDIRGGELANIRILTPSFVVKNKRFDVIVRFEDQYGNLTNNAPEDTLIELSHEHLRENLNWKLFVPETGFISLPNLYFNDDGVYTILLRNKRTKEVFRSSPIQCFSETNKQLFWGLLHGESDRYDATENIENCMRYFRDDRAINFFAPTPFESQEETPNDTWKLISQNVAEFNEEERFTTFLGFQWQGQDKSEGLRTLIYTKDNKPVLRKKDIKYSSLKKLYKSLSPKELISIPSFTMAKGIEFDFSEFDPEFERVVEIYNAWGSNEKSKKEGNPLPITSKGKSGIQESGEGSIQKALLSNLRFGFVAGGLDDRGAYSNLFESEQVQYTPGLTAIIAPTHTREALAEALYQRSCYATTGERIILGLYLANIPMGKETSTAEKPGLAINRHLSGYVAGTHKLKTIEIVRNGKTIVTFEPEDYHYKFEYDDMTPLEKVATNAKDKKPPFVYYYIRVTQEDGHMAWSSPIWVDYIPLASLPKVAKKPVLKPLPKKEIIEDDFEDEEEEEDDFDDYEE